MTTPRLRAVQGFVLLPLLLTSVIFGTLALLRTSLPPPAISGIVLAASVCVMIALERIVPLHRSWNAPPEAKDVLLLVVNRLVDIAVVATVIAVMAQLAMSGLRLTLMTLWPTELPLIAQAVLAIVLGELLRYVMHRLSHRPGLLGRVHLTHHEPRRMYTFNGPRLHPLNQLWIAIANTTPMLIMGAQLPALILAANLTAFFVLFQHANIGLPFKLWNRVLATPDAHRVHHQREQTAKGANYGIVLLVFDRLFGTYVPPGQATGVDDIGRTRLGQAQ